MMMNTLAIVANVCIYNNSVYFAYILLSLSCCNYTSSNSLFYQFTELVFAKTNSGITIYIMDIFGYLMLNRFIEDVGVDGVLKLVIFNG